MIGKLKGKLSEIDGNVGLIETTGGVFYQVFLTPSLIASHQPLVTFELYTYLQVRDDALVLFGFESKKELDFFKLLLSVSGVGPKTAFNVISFIKPEELYQAVKANQVDIFTQVPGLGKKTALKIILELSSRLKSEFDMSKMILSDDDKTVVEALISLGFNSQDAKKIVSKLSKNLSIEQKIKEALKKNK
ncbi:MAG: Holliday junction ATP-dependent DNA helicase RuvA [Candidatus Roizmanbacteria bacterium GW2011_GWA2_35_19]|uniref:Holliday junction branch migration complex subunit RuvA n=2 Tax=Candidatus Roizmaniibacteriota TaxID=1752723 RepID=A0A0G0C2W9_9BACT|nr:MAG: Holliday junction ATP-dependent DNA helicase RuvA [Candidatus Roizmanbacteria bacterium GW2011_GWC2_35_12]KKP70436.1 MAG: Holliday junction ATP-dependent DNA helicase RuvA [Candidatus Roizmanbacteria bacterium GW2011_GWA2_35_19]